MTSKDLNTLTLAEAKEEIERARPTKGGMNGF